MSDMLFMLLQQFTFVYMRIVLESVTQHGFIMIYAAPVTAPFVAGLKDIHEFHYTRHVLNVLQEQWKIITVIVVMKRQHLCICI